MPSQYTDQQKSAALEMLSIGDEISFVKYSTGIPERTLRQWRQNLREQSDCQIAEKTFPAATGLRQETEAPDNQQHNADTDQDGDNSTNTDYEDFNYIRKQLMKYARQMARDLRPAESDSNRRTLALSRVLDRIQLLDQILPEQAKKRMRPPWQDAYEDLLELDLTPWDLIKAEQTATEIDEHLRDRVYKYYAEQHREKGKRA